MKTAFWGMKENIMRFECDFFSMMQVVLWLIPMVRSYSYVRAAESDWEIHSFLPMVKGKVDCYQWVCYLSNIYIDGMWVYGIHLRWIFTNMAVC